MAIGLAFPATSTGHLCDRDGLCCSLSCWNKTLIDRQRVHQNYNIRFICKSPLFGAMQSCWLNGKGPTSTKAPVAADYSDFLSGSSEHEQLKGYHPLEELKDQGRDKDMVLTDAEIAKTVVEANDKALLLLPRKTHCEPHGHISWAEFHYVIDDFGDLFFEVFDGENIFQDRENSNFVTCLIGMGNPIYVESRVSSHIGNFEDDDSTFDTWPQDEKEDGSTDISDLLIKWGMPDTLRHIHPLYFAKCLTKAVQSNYRKQMEAPSNGLAIVGQLRPAFRDEEYYVRKLFHHRDGVGHLSDYRDECEKEEERMAGAYNLIDGEFLSLSSEDEGSRSSILYKLDVITIDLFSVYGDQTIVNLQDFLDAEPDILAHLGPTIIERLVDLGPECSVALKALCRRKKGLIVEGARLIGVDSLGMDVRVFAGLEARTLRFSFASRALSESSAEKKIKRMLFPHHWRRRPRASNDNKNELSDTKSSC